jgi:hypothetical protein
MSSEEGSRRQQFQRAAALEQDRLDGSYGDFGIGW